MVVSATTENLSRLDAPHHNSHVGTAIGRRLSRLLKNVACFCLALGSSSISMRFNTVSIGELETE
eukprot:scaffold478141_cov19-Prasinocladus_malaysianus.AAC.1